MLKIWKGTNGQKYRRQLIRAKWAQAPFSSVLAETMANSLPSFLERWLLKYMPVTKKIQYILVDKKLTEIQTYQ